jgi:transcription initiation factor IIE alpha subunit
MDIFFYCQACDEKITTDQLALLNEGKCPKCGSIEGFSTAPKSENETFDSLTVINDTELLEKSFKE